MLLRIALICLTIGLARASYSSEEISAFGIFKSSIRDLVECYLDNSPTNCLEARTIRSVHEINNELSLTFPLTKLEQSTRSGKVLEDENSVTKKNPALVALESENRYLLKKIQERTNKARGLIGEIGDLFTYTTFKILDPLTGGGSEEEEPEDEESAEVEASKFPVAPISEHDGDLADDNSGPLERGHKKKYLKKKNKQLKLILLLMLIKNKIKMFVNKLQFLVQLKFLLVATINMLANVIRLWIELKKKHKPNKVIYYESAHHQHHYDNEHIHDHDDIHYGPGTLTRPGGYSHHAHHEEEDYGGGPWPWSRSYAEKTADQSYNVGRYPGSHNIVYYNQRPLR